MDLIEAINKRRSVRNFTDKKIDDSIIKEIIRLGTMAPSACNRQAWRFIIITDSSIKEKIKDKFGPEFILHAPAGIIVLYDKYTYNFEYPDNVESSAACMQNMLLAALSFGLGGCWINQLPLKSYLCKILNIPKMYDIMGYIALGYPARDSRNLPRKYSQIEEILSYNTFYIKENIEKRKKGINLLLFIISFVHNIITISPGFIKIFLYEFVELKLYKLLLLVNRKK